MQRGVRLCSVVAQHARQRASPPPPLSSVAANPSALVAAELGHVRSSLLGLLGSAHPGLSSIARYYFLQPSQQLRSLLVLLFAHATNGLGRAWPQKHWLADTEPAAELDQPLSLPDVLNNWHPSMPNHTASFAGVFDLRPTGLYTPPPSIPPSTPLQHFIPRLLPVQIRLAQIVEMVHIASVLHDTVHDTTSLPDEDEDGFGNKLSILAGDFLLGRASAALSRLGEAEVVELVASVIANQAEGEVLPIHVGPTLDRVWDAYLRRTYLKTASLLAKSARAAVVLGGCTGHEGEVWKDVAYAFGRNLGIAYQLVEDTLEYEAGSTGETKPTPGRLVTAPILFAGEEHPELHPLIYRNLADEGDMERAIHLVSKSSGIERTRRLAQSYADKACQAIKLLPDSEPKTALEMLAECAVSRTWL